MELTHVQLGDKLLVSNGYKKGDYIVTVIKITKLKVIAKMTNGVEKTFRILDGRDMASKDDKWNSTSAEPIDDKRYIEFKRERIISSILRRVSDFKEEVKVHNEEDIRNMMEWLEAAADLISAVKDFDIMVDSPLYIPFENQPNFFSVEE